MVKGKNIITIQHNNHNLILSILLIHDELSPEASITSVIQFRALPTLKKTVYGNKYKFTSSNVAIIRSFTKLDHGLVSVLFLLQNNR